MPVNIPQGAGQSPQQRVIRPQMTYGIAQGLKTSAVNETHAKAMVHNCWAILFRMFEFYDPLFIYLFFGHAARPAGS